MSYCYILFSPATNGYYIGATHDSVDERLAKHNSHIYGQQRYTAKADDWEVFIKIKAEDYAHAIRLERYIKSMKSSKYIRNLKKYPELVEKIQNATRS